MALRSTWRKPWRKPWGYPLQDWTPAQLFASGDKGFYVDPIAGLYVFSDTAGTTHAPLAGTVARLDAPPGSPVAASFTNATVSQQPICRVDGLEFDGVDDWLALPDDPALRFGTTSWTLAIAAYADVVTGFRTLLDKRGTVSGPGYNFGLYDGTGRLRIVLQDATQTKLGYAQPNGGWVAGQWVHAIVEIDRSAALVRTYIDNVHQAANNIALGTLADISGTQPLIIGASITSGMYSWDGREGRILMIEKLLSPAERAKLNAWLKEPHS